MRSFKMGKLMGISLELHDTFIWLILAIVLFLAIFDIANLVPTIILLFFLFISVFIHELFHSMVAVSKGANVKKIILLPIGGISVAEELPEKPIDEFLIAIAGPFFNFVVIFIILLLVALIPGLPWPWQLFNGTGISADLLNNAILQYPLFGLFWVNFILGAFNLFLPALPLDGGRVLRSILSVFVGFNKATRLASSISTVIAVALLLLGFLSGNLILLIIAIFIFLGASQENEVAVIKETLKGVDLKGIINKRPRFIDAGQTVIDAFELMEKKNKTAFPVKTRKGITYVSAEMVSSFDREKWGSTKISKIMQKIPSVKPTEASGRIMNLIMSHNYPFVVINDKGRFKGIIEQDEITNLYKLTKILKKL